MNSVKIAIIGNGDRANCYCGHALLVPEDMQVVAIVDPDVRKLQAGAEKYGVPENKLFRSVEAFLADEAANGKSCDGVVNATMDEYHYQTAMPLLKAGYHMLLEKPIVNNEKQLRELRQAAKANNCILMICHVLRYTPFYRRIKEVILSGRIGEIMHIETSENVGIAHSSNSYIRGKWNSAEKCGSSMLLAKCCHDLDMLCWLNGGNRPVSVASFGGRNFLTEEKAPKGATERCLNGCPYVDRCEYSAESIYVKNDRFPEYSWDCIPKAYKDITPEDKLESLKTINPHGVCAYKTGSDIVDHQSVMIRFSNGSTATHSMLQGAMRPCRLIRIMGTLGEIQGMIEESKFVVRTYDFEKAWYQEREYDVAAEIASCDRHAGGDEGIICDFINRLRGGEVSISCTDIDDSINGHLCVFRADEAMRDNAIKNI